MKTRAQRHPLRRLGWLATLCLLSPCLGWAATTIDPDHRFAYAANLGWGDWRGDTTNGAVIGEYVCSGYVHSANVGWINLGGGAPANGIQYQNNGADFGVNHNGLGDLRGYAWGANIGWIAFENTGAPAVDLTTGNLSGHAWSANCGWISLSNTVAFVKTDSILAGADTDADGMADAWELTHTNTLAAFTVSSDMDGDGLSDVQEALADTNPLDANDNLRITSFERGLSATPTRLDMEWIGQPTRRYAIQYRTDLTANGWTDHTVLPGLGVGYATWEDTTDQRFFRVRAFRPLAP